MDNRDNDVISQDDARRAVGVLVELLDGEDARGVLVRERAASSLVRLYLSQRSRAETKNAKPQPPVPRVRDLTAMNPEKLAELRRQMNADFPASSAREFGGGRRSENARP